MAVSLRVGLLTMNSGGAFRIVDAVSGNGADDQRPCHAQMWAALIKDLLDQYGWSQSELSRRIGVSQQTISVWLSGGVIAPSIQTVRAVYQISGHSMLRLLSIAYGWPLAEIGQRAVLDAAAVDESLTRKNRGHLIDQYTILLQHSRAHPDDDDPELPELPPLSDDV